MNEWNERVLYAKISKARESCAGGDVQDIAKVVDYVRDALNYATQVEAPETTLDNLRTALGQLNTAKEYKDRLKPDQILCDILNGMLGD
jgi:hypothetical protein